MLKLGINFERLIHSTKAAIACVIGILLTRILGIPADQWVVITIIVIMCAQLYVGSVRHKAYLRYIGTLIGCLLAAFTLVIFGHTSMAILISISLSTFIFSYFATGQEDIAYAGTLGAVTTTIIMLGIDPSLSFAAQRFLEISAGIFIATFVSQFIFPIHASTHLRRSQAKTLGQLRDYYKESMIIYPTTQEAFDHQDLDENIVKSLLMQRKLAKESATESFTSAFDATHFAQSLYFEREMLRAITFMHHALVHIKQLDILFNQSKQTRAFNEDTIQALNTLIHAIETKNTPNQSIHVPSLELLKTEFQKNISLSSRDDLTYIYGFFFSAEIFVYSLMELAKLHGLLPDAQLAH